MTLTWLPVTLSAKIREELHVELRVTRNVIKFLVKNIAMYIREFVRLWLRVYWLRNLLLCKYFCKELNYYNNVSQKLFAALLYVSCTAVH